MALRSQDGKHPPLLLLRTRIVCCPVAGLRLTPRLTTDRRMPATTRSPPRSSPTAVPVAAAEVVVNPRVDGKHGGERIAQPRSRVVPTAVGAVVVLDCEA
eukprot:927062-Prymnesium_polylepis.2